VRVAVAVFLVCLMAGVAFPQQAKGNAPDAIFYNAKVVTVDPSFSIQQAFAVKGDRFIAVGTNATIKNLRNPATHMVDLHGHTVVPGFADNHNHQYDAALILLRGVNLAGVRSLTEMLNRVRQAVANAKPGETILGSGGWSEARLVEQRGPTRYELDQLSTDHSIVLMRTRASLYLNTAALNALGISRETESFEGNRIPKDANGEPTGVISGVASAMKIAVKLAPETDDQKRQLILTEQKEQNALGLTSIREVSLSPETMRIYYQLWLEKKLTMRVSMGLDVGPNDAQNMGQILSAWGVGPGFGNDWLRLDCVGEFAIDLVPYLRESPANSAGGKSGSTTISADLFRNAVVTMNRYGWRPAIHISGDKALDVVLDGYSAADREHSIRERRWVVEHIPLVHPDQMDRMSQLGVVVSAQFQTYGGYDGMVRTLGEERAEGTVPMREMLDHHLVVSAGSDWPGATNNPIVPFYFYVTRKTFDGKLVGAKERISREEALRVATINEAYTTYEEKVKGSIEAGKLADFVILSQDILTVPEEQILATHPLATFVGGQEVFASSNGGF